MNVQGPQYVVTGNTHGTDVYHFSIFACIDCSGAQYAPRAAGQAAVITPTNSNPAPKQLAGSTNNNDFLAHQQLECPSCLQSAVQPQV